MSFRETQSGPLAKLFASFKEGEIDRRTFIARAGMLGVGAAGAAFMANTGTAVANGYSTRNGFAFSAQENGGGERPAVGTEDQERGEGGELRMLQWQAASFLSPHVATGSKEFLTSSCILEPLMHYLPDSTLVPNLIEEVPTFENGLLAEDMTSVTYHLLPDVVWSDGEPFTAEDVRFTWEWVSDEANASTNIEVFSPIEDIEVVDELTVNVVFGGPNPQWYEAHAGTTTGFVYPQHILENGEDAHEEFRFNPIGTGPYVVDSFTPNDQTLLVANENYREPNKPFFQSVNIVGGGDAVSAARAVIQTGDYDFAWNLQVEPDVIGGMEGDDAPGRLVVGAGANVERIDFNFTDPNEEVDGQRSHLSTEHPAFGDPLVREAYATAIDRDLIANTFYQGGDDEPPTANFLAGIPEVESQNTSFEYDPERAMELLDEAGWEMNGDVREKDGVQLSINYATSINDVRQRTQQVVSANLQEVGFAVELVEVDASVYFDASPGNEQNINHFYWDTCMYQSVPNSPTPLPYMENFYGGPDGENIAQEENGWTRTNYSRFQDEDYDALFEQARTETDPEVIADLFIQMNDRLWELHATVPLVNVGSATGVSNRLREENIGLAPFSYDYWNIANWNLADDAEPED